MAPKAPRILLIGEALGDTSNARAMPVELRLSWGVASGVECYGKARGAIGSIGDTVGSIGGTARVPRWH